jgi:hypothetical protein
MIGQLLQRRQIVPDVLVADFLEGSAIKGWAGGQRLI